MPDMAPGTTNAGWYIAAGMLVLNLAMGVHDMVIAQQSSTVPISAQITTLHVWLFLIVFILWISLFSGLINRSRWAKLAMIAFSFTGVLLALFLLPRWAINLFGGRWIAGLAMITQPAAWILLLADRGTWGKVCLGLILHVVGLGAVVYVQMHIPLE